MMNQKNNEHLFYLRRFQKFTDEELRDLRDVFIRYDIPNIISPMAFEVQNEIDKRYEILVEQRAIIKRMLENQKDSI